VGAAALARHLRSRQTRPHPISLDGELNYQNAGGEAKIAAIIEKLLAEPE